MVIQARFGAAQTGLGYQFYDSGGVLLGVRITAGISSLPETGSYIATATVPAGAAGVLWDSDTSTAAEDLREALASPSVPSALEIADAVWDELVADHTLTGSTGLNLAASGASGDPWIRPVPGEYADGTAGAAIGRLNNTPADSPVAIAPVPDTDPDLCVVYVDTETMLGAVVSTLSIRLQLGTAQPAISTSGRIVSAAEVLMVYDVDTPGRYTATLEKGLIYKAQCGELWRNGLEFAVAASDETLDLSTV